MLLDYRTLRIIFFMLTVQVSNWFLFYVDLHYILVYISSRTTCQVDLHFKFICFDKRKNEEERKRENGKETLEPRFLFSFFSFLDPFSLFLF